jgi:hypothetical protein
VIVYDLMDEYDAHEFDAAPVYYFKDLIFCLQRGEPRIIFKPRTDRAEVFEFFCAVIWTHAKHLKQAKDYVIWVSEFRQLMPKAGPYALSIINRGRHYNLALSGDTQRILNLDKDYVANVHVFYIGRVFLPNEMRYLEEFLPADVLAKKAELKKYQFLRYVPNPDDFDLPESERVIIVDNTRAELITK